MPGRRSLNRKLLWRREPYEPPFAGRLGVRRVDRGQYVNAGTPIVTLQQLDPIFAEFFLPQQDLNVINTGQSLKAAVDTYPGLKFTGVITAINPKVDMDSRNVQVRARLENPDKKLLPGMFATITVEVGTPSPQIVLPRPASVVYNAYGDAVYVVEDNNGQDPTVRYQFVTLGKTRGDMVAILSGVKEGETVVTAGQVKLRNGTKIKADNSILLSTDIAPTPANP